MSAFPRLVQLSRTPEPFLLQCPGGKHRGGPELAQPTPPSSHWEGSMGASSEETSPKMETSTWMWSTSCSSAQGTQSSPHLMTTAHQKHHCNAFGRSFLMSDAVHGWCIPVGCPTDGSWPKSANKLFQTNPSHKEFFKSCLTLLTNTGYQHSCGFFFPLSAASQHINHAGFLPKGVQERTESTCRFAGPSKAYNIFNFSYKVKSII